MNRKLSIGEGVNIPDISGYQTKSLPYDNEWQQLIRTSPINNVTLSQHNLKQMLSAQATGEKIGFLVYDNPEIEYVGGSEQNFVREPEATFVGKDDSGKEYFIAKVSMPTVLHKLMIDSVKILSRDRDDTPDGKLWSAIAVREYWTEGAGHYGSREKVSYKYIIEHNDGITTLSPKS